jgi:hypothetical protein
VLKEKMVLVRQFFLNAVKNQGNYEKKTQVVVWFARTASRVQFKLSFINILD